MEYLNTIIVDDENLAINLLTGLLKPFNEVIIESTFTDPELAIEGILNAKPDLLFLDIQMGKMTGFQVLESVWEGGLRPHVIFVTAYDEFAIEALRHSAVDYLLKPVDPNELKVAIQRIAAKKETTNVEHKITELLAELKKDNRIRFNTRTGFVLVDQAEIMYCQADGNYVKIYCNQGHTETISLNLSQVEELLPESKFIRVSRSYLINTRYLRKIDRKTRTIFLEHNNTMTTVKYSADRYGVLDWLFGGRG